MILYTTNVTGLAHSGYKLFASKVQPGTELTLQRDPENAYDPFAIKILMPDGTHLGWVQRIKTDSFSPAQGQTAQTVISNLLEAGFELHCKVSAIHPGAKEFEGKVQAEISITKPN